MRINGKAVGLVLGGAAVVASAAVAIGHDNGGFVTPITLAKNAVSHTGDTPYTTPSEYVRSGGSDSGATTTTAGPGS